MHCRAVLQRMQRVLLVKASLESCILVRLYGDVAFMVVYCTIVVVSCLSSCGFMSLVMFAVLFISMTLFRNIYFEMVLIYLLYSLYYKCFVIVMLRNTIILLFLFKFFYFKPYPNFSFYFLITIGCLEEISCRNSFAFAYLYIVCYF